MWCTRWFLPLLLLPLPTAPPYFLLLFLLALTLHARPCFYCIVLLSAIFVSSCYWAPFPIDSPLSSPWAPNITTFSEALNASIPSAELTQPSVIRAVDRCWCDLTSGSFFEPFNVTRWEQMSVQRLQTDLLRKKAAEDALALENEKAEGGGDETPAILDSEEKQSTDASRMPLFRPTIGNNSSIIKELLAGARSIFRRARSSSSLLSMSSDDSPLPVESQESTLLPLKGLPIIRKEYDLRPYGFDVVFDFGWSR